MSDTHAAHDAPEDECPECRVDRGVALLAELWRSKISERRAR